MAGNRIAGKRASGQGSGRYSWSGLALRGASVGILVVGVAAGAMRLAAGADGSGHEAVAIVRSVESGETFTLDQPIKGADGVRLAGIRAPKPIDFGDGGMDASASALAAAARDALATLVEGQAVRLTIDKRTRRRGGGTTIDRHGRLLASVQVDDDRWVQGDLVRHGWARVDFAAGGPVDGAVLLALEEEARQARRGLWASMDHAVRTPKTVVRHLHSFQIVQGRVVDAARVRARIYLNFGHDYRTDFTVTIAADALERFEAANLNPLELEGQLIRVRGWVQPFNGPQIDVTDPRQIELIEP